MESLIKMDKSKKCYNLGAKSATTLLIFFLVKTSLPSHVQIFQSTDESQ